MTLTLTLARLRHLRSRGGSIAAAAIGAISGLVSTPTPAPVSVPAPVAPPPVSGSPSEQLRGARARMVLPTTGPSASQSDPKPSAWKAVDNARNPRPLQLRPRTNFKQYRKPRGLSSVARRRQNTKRKGRK